MISRRSHHAANTPALAGAPTEREKYAPSMPHCRPRMKARPQMTSAEPMIRMPAWRNASPKKRKTRRRNISPNTCAANFAMSPSAPSQLTGACRRNPTPDWRYFGWNDVNRLLGGRTSRLAQQRVGVEDGLADRHDLLPDVARLGSDHLERGSLIERVALHQDALGAFDERAARHRFLEVDGLSEALHRDLDRAAQRLALERAGVGEDAGGRGLLHELRVLALGHRDHRADRFSNDLADHRQGVIRVVVVQAHYRYVRPHVHRRFGNVRNLYLSCHHVVTEAPGDIGDLLETPAMLVGHKYPQRPLFQWGH